MGIKNLNKYIKKYSSESISTKSIKDLSNSKIAVDSEILLYKSRSYINNIDVKYSEYHIKTFYNFVRRCLKYNITPVFIFDGEYPAEKSECMRKRKLKKQKQSKELDSLQSKFLSLLNEFSKVEHSTLSNKFNEVNEVSTRSNKSNTIIYDYDNPSKEILDLLDTIIIFQSKYENISDKYRDQCKEFLRLLGLTVIECNTEAEAYCIYLAQKGVVDYVYTEDTDAIVYSLVNQFNETNQPRNQPQNQIKILKKHANGFQQIDTSNLLKNFNLNSEQFIEFCILLGSDYTNNKTSLNRFNDNNLSNFLLKNKNYLNEPEAKNAKNIFMNFSKDFVVAEIKLLTSIKKTDKLDKFLKGINCFIRF